MVQFLYIETKENLVFIESMVHRLHSFNEIMCFENQGSVIKVNRYYMYLQLLMVYSARS
jgi:hypothetical protein